ncbi:MAG: restriction endonuclease [Verrucomicrobiaceae bacterium]|nr:restriction endonuclease [Verrucomicrobiaceae bacterium]
MTWNDYQEATATHFRQLGHSAETNQTVTGVRATHDIDVLVRSKTSAVECLWVVECKRWNRAVTKQCVLTLQQVVSDIGADRGFLLSESGFQSGALDAVRSSNITLTTLAGLSCSAEELWFGRQSEAATGIYRAWYRDDEDSGNGPETYIYLERRDEPGIGIANNLCCSNA